MYTYIAVKHFSVYFEKKQRESVWIRRDSLSLSLSPLCFYLFLSLALTHAPTHTHSLSLPPSCSVVPWYSCTCLPWNSIRNLGLAHARALSLSLTQTHTHSRFLFISLYTCLPPSCAVAHRFVHVFGLLRMCTLEKRRDLRVTFSFSRSFSHTHLHTHTHTLSPTHTHTLSPTLYLSTEEQRRGLRGMCSIDLV